MLSTHLSSVIDPSVKKDPAEKFSFTRLCLAGTDKTWTVLTVTALENFKIVAV